MTEPSNGNGESSKVIPNSGVAEQRDNEDQHCSANMKIGDEDSLFQQSNPFQIDLILEIFFSFCSANTLKNCRLVCKQWRDLSLQSWRDKAMLNLSSKLKRGELGSSSSRSLPLKDYLLQHIQCEKGVSLIPEETGVNLQLEVYPFRNLQISSSILEYSTPDTKPITDFARQVILHEIKTDLKSFGEFLIKVPSVDSLELRNCDLDYRGMSFPIIENLKRLRFYLDEMGRNGVPENIVYDTFPNLKSLSLEFRTDTPRNENLTNNMKFLRSSTKKKSELTPVSLKELEVIHYPLRGSSFANWNQPFNAKLFKIIGKCNFRLEKLVLDFAFSRKMKINLGIRSIHPLLESCRESLKYLRISFYFDMDYFIDNVIPNCRMNFMELKPWKRKMKGAVKPVSNIKITLDALKEMKLANGLWGFYLLAHLHPPNLEKLAVECGKCTKKVNILQYQAGLLKENVHEKLESFELLDCYEIPGPETISLFSNMMPNLIQLSVPLDKQAFRTVCQRFTTLKTLNILAAHCQYSKLDDEALTGVSKEGNEEAGRQPNITDLTLLTDLSISNDVAFTDHAVMYGFLQLRRLYSLKVAFKKFSEDMKDKLLKHVKGPLKILEEKNCELMQSESDADIESEEDSHSDDSDSDDPFFHLKFLDFAELRNRLNLLEAESDSE